MLFHFDFKSSVLFFFFFHGLVFSGLLFAKAARNQDKASRWLAAFVLLCCLYIAPFMLGYAGWYSRDPYRSFMFYMPFQQLLLMPPVLYFYCRTLFDRSFVFTAKDCIHFVPAFLYLLYTLVVFIADRLVLGYPYFYEDQRDKDFSFWYQALGFLLMVYYTQRSWILYNNYKRITRNTVSYADALLFQWARNFLFCLFSLLLLRALFFILNPEWDEFGRKFWYYTSFCLLFYYVSISGLLNSVRSLAFFRDWEYTPAAETQLESGQAVAVDSEKGSASSLLPDLEEWKGRIEGLMTEKRMYENPELTVAEFSVLLGTHAKKISQVVNQGFGMNFNDFVNSYRVAAVINKMNEGEHTIQTLLALAFECGFNSKSTFNRAFKKQTGLSPNDFVKKKLS